jgi:hypothetical protein
MNQKDNTGHTGLIIDVADGSEPNIENFNIDKRCNHPNSFYSEEADKIATYFKTFNVFISGHDTRLALPNEISISLSILEKSWDESVILKKEIINSIKKGRKSITRDLMAVQFDYIEKMYTSVIFSYKSVESFCNASIPDDYEYQTTKYRVKS